jgi:hypothetical protein
VWATSGIWLECLVHSGTDIRSVGLLYPTHNRWRGILPWCSEEVESNVTGVGHETPSRASTGAKPLREEGILADASPTCV